MTDAEHEENAALGKMVNEITISYSVRELLKDIREAQIKLEGKLERFATKEDVKELTAQVKELEELRNRLIGFFMACGLFGALTGGGMSWLVSTLGGT